MFQQSREIRDAPLEGNHGRNDRLREENTCGCIPHKTSCFFCWDSNQVSLRTGFLAFVVFNLLLAISEIVTELVNKYLSDKETGDAEEAKLRHLEGIHDLRFLRMFRGFAALAVYTLGIYAGVSRKIGLVKAYLMIRVVFAGLYIGDQVEFIASGQASRDAYLLGIVVVILVLMGWELVVSFSFYRVLLRGGTGSECYRGASPTPGGGRGTVGIGQPMHHPSGDHKHDTVVVAVKTPDNPYEYSGTGDYQQGGDYQKGDPTGIS